MCYCIGVNRIGKDGNDLDYSGHSGVYDPLGNTLAFENDANRLIHVSLSKEQLQKIRLKLPFLKDRDQFEIISLNKQ